MPPDTDGQEEGGRRCPIPDTDNQEERGRRCPIPDTDGQGALWIAQGRQSVAMRYPGGWACGSFKPARGHDGNRRVWVLRKICGS